MKHVLSAALLAMVWPLIVAADGDLKATVARGVAEHVLPKVAAFAAATAELETAAQACETGPDTIQAPFHQAMDDWTRMSHLRFGPTETEDRAFAIAFWPDGRGKTPKALTALLLADNLVSRDPAAFQEISIAARGLYALELMLFDDRLSTTATALARCRLILAIARDLASNAHGIAEDWRKSYAQELTQPSPEGRYRSDQEATQELFKAVSLGLQFTAETRLGRPLGSFERPRPNRAELRRSGRSMRQVQMALEGTGELALILAQDVPGLKQRLADIYGATLALINELDDPVFAGVSRIQGRLRVEIIQQSIGQIRDLVTLELGPALGVGEGFNALDGD